MSTFAIRRIDDRLDAGDGLDQIEATVLDPAFGLDEDQRAALWLYAWVRTSRVRSGRADTASPPPPSASASRPSLVRLGAASAVGAGLRPFGVAGSFFTAFMA